MALRAEVKASVTQNHRDLVAQRKVEAERELTKMKLLHEMFGISQKLLEQRVVQLQGAEQPPSAIVFEGLAAAKIEFGNLERQAIEAVMRHDGAFMALNAMDESLRQQEMQATARARGLPVQGEKLVQMAESVSGEMEVPPEESQESPEEPQEAPQASGGQQDVPGFLDSLGNAEEPPQEPAKKPMAVPKQRTTKKRSRRKA